MTSALKVGLVAADIAVAIAGPIVDGYYAVKAWADAVARPGTTDFDPAVAAPSSDRSATPLGDVAFDADGGAKLPGCVIHEWRDGDHAEYAPR